ncbi:MAG: AAA family ATPase [Bacteroidota bacterium]
MTKLTTKTKAYPTDPVQAVWKFCPPTLKTWESFYQKGFMALKESEEEVGDLTQYESPATLGEAAGMAPQRAVIQSLKHFRDANIGDIVIAAKGKSTILGVGIITGSYTYQERKSDFPHMRKVDWVITRALSVKAIRLPGRDFIPLVNWSEIQALYQEHYPELTATLAALHVSPASFTLEDPEQYLYKSFTREDALHSLFLSEQEFDTIVSVLLRKKNLILQGPPGVGKTFLAKQLAFACMGFKDESRVEWVQLHPSYAYEDFVQGIRPSPEGGFERRDGIFYKFCLRAKKDPIRNYFFILDEINRANLSNVLGELFMLLEADKRRVEFAMPLTYGKNSMEKFYIPPNLHLIGTMNTADRSLAPIDFALRRRFAFVELTPQFGKKFQAHLDFLGISSALQEKISQRISEVNQRIREHPYLGKGYEIGHSFFCHKNPTEEEDNWYQMIIQTEIGPLLESYWPDEPERVQELVTLLLSP